VVGVIDRCIRREVDWSEYERLPTLGLDEIALKKGHRDFVVIAKEELPGARVVADRFHVARKYRECADQLRKKEIKRLKQELTEPEYEEIKGAMWPFRKRPEDLTPEEEALLHRLTGRVSVICSTSFIEAVLYVVVFYGKYQRAFLLHQQQGTQPRLTPLLILRSVVACLLTTGSLQQQRQWEAFTPLTAGRENTQARSVPGLSTRGCVRSQGLL
jgi:hypothetical protein